MITRNRRRAGAVLLAAGAIAATSVVATSGANAAAEPTEIGVYIGFTDYRLDWMEGVAAAFEANHPDYDIVVRGFSNYEDLLAAASLAQEQGAPPAIAQYFEVATQVARDAEGADGSPLFASVEEAIAGRTEILGEPVVLDDIVSAVKDYYTIEGSFSSMPWNSSTTLMYGNSAILTEAGVEALPETWDEVKAACEAVAALPTPPSGGCITWPNHGWFFEQSLGQQGELLANNDNGRSARADEVFLDSEGMLNWVNYWNDLATAGHYVYAGDQRNWDFGQNGMTSGNFALILTSSGDASAIVSGAAETGFEPWIGRMPYNSDVDYAGNLIGGATLWLINGLDETTQDGALAFMQFLNNPENAGDWHKTTGYIPITNGAIEHLTETGWFDENPWAMAASDQLAMTDGSAAARGALLGGFPAIRNVMTQAMEDVLLTGADPAERFAEATDEAQAVLDDYNAFFG